MADELNPARGETTPAAGPADSGTRAEDLFARVVLALDLVSAAEMELARRELPVPRGSQAAAAALRELLVNRGRLDPDLADAIDRVVALAIASGRPGPPRAGVLEKPVPTGEGFALRSKKDIELAWASRRKDAPPPPAATARSSGEPQRAPPEAGEPGTDQRPGGPPPDQVEPKPDERGVRPAGPEPGAPQAPRAPEARAAEAERRRKRTFAALRRESPGGAEEQVDIDAIKAELGLDSKAAGETRPPGLSADAKTREIALRAFVRRAVPGMLQAHCLGVVARRRSAAATASRLAQEAGCTVQEAAGVLELWRQAGLVRPDPTGIPEYQFAPAETDLVLIREFLRLWADETWHRRLLEWVLEED